MLAALAEQIQSHSSGPSVPETIICFDSEDTTEAKIRSAIKAAVPATMATWPGVLRVVASAQPLDYYQKKNFGFTFTTNDVLVFLDSDVVPEAGWLTALLAAVDDGQKAVVMGRTHLETGTLFERAIALSWIFEVRSDSVIHPVRRFVSNNFAIRRGLFERISFPNRTTYRGQCTELGLKLMGAGFVLYEEPHARGVHPAHDGARGFVMTALHAGRDSHFYDRQKGVASRRLGFVQWRNDLANVSSRIRSRRTSIGARTVDVLAARILGFVYYLIKLTAYQRRLPRR